MAQAFLYLGLMGLMGYMGPMGPMDLMGRMGEIEVTKALFKRANKNTGLTPSDKTGISHLLISLMFFSFS